MYIIYEIYKYEYSYDKSESEIFPINFILRIYYSQIIC